MCPAGAQVIEAALEDVGLKQKIFADLEAACRPDAILSTNTSTIDISLVGAKTRAADRIVGAHFFSPAHIMPLLEIVRTPATSKQARAPRPNPTCTPTLP
jgi:enoyl-CoA hydratase/3-hydroxyacyl-CoA dehydrogenase